MTQDGDTFDALDQVSDVPKPTETLFAYRKVSGTDSSGFIDYTDRATGRRKGRTFVSADYVFFKVQPDDATMRDIEQRRHLFLVTKEQ